MKTNSVIESKRSFALAKCDELLAAYKSGNIDQINTAQEAADKAASDLTAEIHNAYFEEWAAADEPIKAALACLWVDGEKITVKRNGKTKEVTSVDLDETRAIFSLDELNAWCKDKGHKRFTAGGEFAVLADKASYYTARRALYELASEKPKNLKDIDGKLSDAKLSCDYPVFAVAKGSDITSNKTIEKVLQRLLDEIIFIPDESNSEKNSLKVRASVDGTFFLWTAYQWNKRTGRLVNPNGKTITSQMLCIAHHILSGKGYEELFDFSKRK